MDNSNLPLAFVVVVVCDTSHQPLVLHQSIHAHGPHDDIDDRNAGVNDAEIKPQAKEVGQVAKKFYAMEEWLSDENAFVIGAIFDFHPDAVGSLVDQFFLVLPICSTNFFIAWPWGILHINSVIFEVETIIAAIIVALFFVSRIAQRRSTAWIGSPPEPIPPLETPSLSSHETWGQVPRMTPRYIAHGLIVQFMEGHRNVDGPALASLHF